MKNNVLRVFNVIEEGKVGGPQVRMVRVAAALADRTDTVIVMPRANSGPFREMCDVHGVRYRALPLTRITKEWGAALAYLLFSPLEVLRLARLFREGQADLVHASGGSWQYKAVIAARIAGVPVVWHLNDTSMPSWVRQLFRLLQPMANGFIHTSSRVKTYYGRYISGDRPFALIPPPVDVDKYSPSVEFSGDEDILTLFGNEPVIGTIGNVNPVKGLETLLRAAGRLHTLGFSPHVVIVGTVFDRQQRYYKELLQLARDLRLERIHFVGGRADVRPLLARFDIYVCSSLAESWGMAAWEAMAMARPVVSTDVGDVSFHVKNGESGFVVPVGDAERMADRLVELFKDAALRQRMGVAARREVRRLLAPGVVADKTLAFYREVIDVSV